MSNNLSKAIELVSEIRTDSQQRYVYTLCMLLSKASVEGAGRCWRSTLPTWLQLGERCVSLHLFSPRSYHVCCKQEHAPGLKGPL